MTAELSARGISKSFGRVEALSDVSLEVVAGQVTCLIGDNGAGKSTLIKVLSGVYAPDAGDLLVRGENVTLTSPRQARELGIATVFQDLAMVPLMAIWRNFVLGQEPMLGRGVTSRVDVVKARQITMRGLERVGIELRDPDQPIGTLSGGERQAVAIARAAYFGARVLILDEPTSALGVKEAAIVLRYVLRAKRDGLGIVFITHNLTHAYAIGDVFTCLDRGAPAGSYAKGDLTLEELGALMAGGTEFEALAEILDP